MNNIENCGKPVITTEGCGVCEKCLLAVTIMSGIVGFYEKRYGEELKAFKTDAMNEAIKKFNNE